MKSLSQYILESQKETPIGIFKRCEDISGRTNSDDANDIIRNAKKMFESNDPKEISFDDFKKNAKDGQYYLLFDSENCLMCVNKGQSFNVAQILKNDKLLNVYGKENNYEVNGNLHYGLKGIIELVEKRFDVDKMSVWSIKIKLV